MTLKRLTLVQSWVFLSLRISLFGCTLLAEPFFCLFDFGVLEKDSACINRVRSVLSICWMLQGYSLESKPNMPDLAAILVFHGTAGSILTIGFITKRMLALEKPIYMSLTRENKVDQSRSSGCGKELTRFRQSLLFSSSVKKRQKEALLAGWFGCNVARAFSRACSFDLIFVHIWV